MRRWQTWTFMAVLCVANSSNAKAQSLFERLGQAFSTETPPPVTAPATEAAPAPPAAEDLPAPPSAAPSYTGRPTLGVTVDPLTDDVVRQHRLPVRSGAIITAIVPGSPAAQAGLPLGAVIVALDGRRIDSPANLVTAVSSAPTDREIELSYYDGDRLYRKRVHLLGAAIAQAAPAAPAPVRREPQPLRGGTSLEEQLGGQGQRPVLGRVGQLLDGLVAPASGAAPFTQPAADANETALLREQVSYLQQELEAVRARLAAIELQLKSQASE
ncbi:MAG: PDZ domain-containing protein [Planctomycetaceae bacterium]|nr:PDZ domain-containing protein [Planctomycetales bacterium]MCB9926905.1 PDZ domain-containing protein [Planctomycetaceae bacterium]